MKFRKYLKNIVLMFIFILIVSINVFYFVKYDPFKINSVQVEDVVSDEVRSGLRYQTVVLDLQGDSKQTDYEVINSEDELKTGDFVIYEQLENEELRIIGKDRSSQILIVSLLFLALIVLAVGIDDIYYLFPIFTALPTFVSGLFSAVAADHSPILAIVVLLGPGLLGSVYYFSSQTRQAARRLSFILLSLFLVLILNELLARLLGVNQAYNNYLNFRLYLEPEKYWILFNYASIIMSFGVFFDIINKFEQILKTQKAKWVDSEPLIKAMIAKSQSYIARQTKTLFFVFLGFATLPIFVAGQTNQAIWNSSSVLEILVSFISIALVLNFSIYLYLFVVMLVERLIKTQIKLNIKEQSK